MAMGGMMVIMMVGMMMKMIKQGVE
jgi:hypothetical protein